LHLGAGVAPPVFISNGRGIFGVSEFGTLTKLPTWRSSTLATVPSSGAAMAATAEILAELIGLAQARSKMRSVA
jgi:hypothetical protein